MTLQKSTPNYDLATVAECYAFLGHKKETEIMLINPNKQGDVQIFFIHSKEELFDLLRKFAGKGYNFYVGIHERTAGGTKGINVKSVKTIIIDIDAVRVDFNLSQNKRQKLPAGKKELMLAEAVADTIIKQEFIGKGFKRPVKCMSGNGWQLWTAIPKIKITDENRQGIGKRILAFNRQLRKKYFNKETALIDNIGDLARVIKLIGTKSVKGRETEGARPHRLSYSTEPLLRDEDRKLLDYILNLPVKAGNETYSGKIEKSYSKESPPINGRIKRISGKDRKLKMLLKGDTRDFKSRSEAEASLISKLIYYQFTKSEIFQIMDKSGCTKWQESPNNYRERTFCKIKAYVKRLHGFN